jgi:hypothetical protein
MRVINLIPTNDPPVVTTSSENDSYTVGNEPITVDGALTVVDPDSANLQSATVTVGGFADSDVLDWAPIAGITGSYDGATGVLTLTGVDTVAHYQQTLASVSYSTENEEGGATRTIAFRVTDTANAMSAPASKTIDISVYP